MTSPPRLIEIDKVCLFRNGVSILDDFSLSINLGQHTVILGPNGSGKTSFLKILMRFFYPSVVEETIGRVEILGESAWNVWELRTHLGYVNSEIDFHFSHGRSGRLSAMEAVLTGFSSSELEVEPEHITPTMLKAAKQALEDREILHLQDRKVAHLSTGERRRVLIARAMAHAPKALILDEPTTGLDIAARAALLQQLQRIAERGTTLVLVTHHVEEIIPAISQIIHLQAGRVAFSGGLSNGLDQERLSNLFGVKVSLQQDSRGYYALHLA
jgi:iron complex transport system ATP-binding protein